MENIHEILRGKWGDGTRPRDLYAIHISSDPSQYLKVIVKGLSSDERRIQSGCAEIASLLSEDKPEVLYPNVDVFIENLSARPPVLRWEAVCTLGNLIRVDTKNKIPQVIDKIMSFLADSSIVLQGHSVRALAKIARARPELASEILDNFVSSEKLFPRGRVGFLVEAMAAFAGNKELESKVRDFVEIHVVSDYNSVSRKARRVLKLLDKAASQ
ncbi:MAG: hypothetical protein ACXADL_10455 [Candidatus Thorarchaeota archaeon]|jgi:hypothetical protein